MPFIYFIYLFTTIFIHVHAGASNLARLVERHLKGIDPRVAWGGVIVMPFRGYGILNCNFGTASEGV